MSRYVWIADATAHASRWPAIAHSFEGADFYNRATGYPMQQPQRRGVCAPAIHGDIADHLGPSGRIVHGRRGKREEHKWMAGERNQPTCDWEPISNRPKGLTCEKFARRRGLKTSEAAKEWLGGKMKASAKAAGLA